MNVHLFLTGERLSVRQFSLQTRPHGCVYVTGIQETTAMHLLFRTFAFDLMILMALKPSNPHYPLRTFLRGYPQSTRPQPHKRHLLDER